MNVSYHSFLNKLRGILIIMVWILILFIFPLVLFSTGYESDQAKGRNQTSATFESSRLSANQSGNEANETPKNRTNETPKNERYKLSFYGGSMNATDQELIYKMDGSANVSKSGNSSRPGDQNTTNEATPLASPLISHSNEDHAKSNQTENNEKDTHSNEPKLDADGWVPAWIGDRSKATSHYNENDTGLVTYGLVMVLFVITMRTTQDW